MWLTVCDLRQSTQGIFTQPRARTNTPGRMAGFAVFMGILIKLELELGRRWAQALCLCLQAARRQWTRVLRAEWRWASRRPHSSILMTGSWPCAGWRPQPRCCWPGPWWWERCPCCPSGRTACLWDGTWRYFYQRTWARFIELVTCNF